MRDLFANDPILRNDPSAFDFEREEKMTESFKKVNRLMKITPIPIDYKSTAWIGIFFNGD